MNQTFYKTHIAYWLALSHSTCSSSLQSELQITHANTPTALSHFKNVISDTITQARKQMGKPLLNLKNIFGC